MNKQNQAPWPAKFIVTLDGYYVSDVQTLPGNDGLNSNNQEDLGEFWRDFGDGHAEIVLRIIEAMSEEDAKQYIGREFNYDVAKLNAYKLAKY